MVKSPKTIRQVAPIFSLEGFTLIEIIIVIALTLLLLTATLQTIIGSTAQLTFINNTEKVLDLFRQARSLAIAGKAQLDYTDFDKDNVNDTSLNGGPDYVTPAHYGVHFHHADSPLTPDTVTLFIDNHEVTGENPKEGRFDKSPTNDALNYRKGYDIILEEYALPPEIRFINLPENDVTLFYSTLLADISFDPLLSDNTAFFSFGLEQKSGSAITAMRQRCFQMHKLAGIAEPSNTCP
jgi:type II secretory pathway pseudopilin PulG